MRKLRQLKPKAYYHVTTRVNWQFYIFDDDNIKMMYRQVLKDARKKYKFTLKNYVIMGNHVHLLIKPWVGESLSLIMKWIQQTFAKRYNVLHNRTGHVWYDRFHSVLITCKERLIQVFHYISKNPEKVIDPVDSIKYKFGGLYEIYHKIFDVLDPPGFLENYINFN